MPEEAGLTHQVSQTEAVPATSAPTEGETALPKGESESTQVEQPKKSFSQEEVDRIAARTRAREQRKYEHRIGSLEARLNDALARIQPQASAPQQPKELRQEDFSSFEAFIEAKAERKAQEAFERLQKQQSSTESQRAEQARLAELERNFAKSEDAARDKYDDYDDVVGLVPPGTLNQRVIEFLGDSEHGGELLYQLASDPKELAKIAKLSPTAAVRELVKRELQIKDAPKPSGAPAPVRQISGLAVPASDSPSERDDMAAWIKKRNAQVHPKR